MGKTKRLGLNVVKKAYLKLNQAFFLLPFTNAILPEERRYFDMELKGRQNFLKCSIYPDRIENYYKREVEKESFPTNYNMWMEK